MGRIPPTTLAAMHVPNIAEFFNTASRWLFATTPATKLGPLTVLSSRATTDGSRLLLLFFLPFLLVFFNLRLVFGELSLVNSMVTITVPTVIHPFTWNMPIVTSR